MTAVAKESKGVQIEKGWLSLISFSEKQQENIKQDLKGVRFLLNEGT